MGPANLDDATAGRVGKNLRCAKPAEMHPMFATFGDKCFAVENTNVVGRV